MSRLSLDIAESSTNRLSFVYRCWFVFLLYSLLAGPANAQLTYGVETQIFGASHGAVPFWMRSNQYGSIPLAGVSSSVLGRAKREFSSSTNSEGRRTFDWGLGVEGRGDRNLHDTKVTLIEGYLKGRLGIVELKVGRSKETMGITGDTTLTSGAFAVSGNALGIPKLSLSIPDYCPIRIGDGILAVKGSFSHGWIGETPIHGRESLVGSVNTFLHQKSLYLRLGRSNWRLQLYGGFNHQVYWGNEKSIFGRSYALKPLQTFKYVFLGQRYGSSNTVATSKIGNHLGSIDLAATYRFSSLVLDIYRQNIYDVGALYYLANLRDGLNGIQITNSGKTNATASWHKLLFEFLYTKNQAGEIWSKLTKSGDENYYNNYMYKDGYSYKGQGVGLPLITTTVSTREELLSPEKNYFNNNRVIAFHFGVEARYMDWIIFSKITASTNFGTFDTSIWGSSLGRTRNASYGEFGKHKQVSCYLEAKKQFDNKVTLAFATAFDNGSLLDNSTGVLLRAAKEF